MSLRFQLVLAALVCSTAALAQPPTYPDPGPLTLYPDAFQVRYAANLNIGESYVNITNTGASDIPAPITTTGFTGGNLCVSVYTFDPGEEMLSCCTCTVTPNGLASLGVNGSLLSNTLTGEHPSSAVIKLVATSLNPFTITIGGTPTTVTPTCNAYAGSFPSLATAALALAPGMVAWGTTLHALPTTPVTYGVTETRFSNSALSLGEFEHLTNFCAFITPNGSNPGASTFGICSACKPGALGATKTQ